MLRIAALSSALLALTITPSSATEVTLYGAGSLAGVLGEVSAAYSRATGVVVHQQFGPSGMMRERIEKGAKVDVFASADLGHPRQLVADGRAGFVVRFTGNRLCAMAKPELGLTSANVLDKALEPTIKLGTSTPVADPGGDYTWKVFDRAEVLRPGAGVALKNKALKLVGGPQAEKIPAGRGAIPYLLETGKADLFIAYCTTGKQAAQESVALTVANLPAALTEIADYGLVVLKDAAPDAAHFALFMLSETGQAIFAKRGFEATLPRAEPK